MEKKAGKGLEDCSWFPFSDEPIITSPWYAPGFSDPNVLVPSESCDGKWHIFFHSKTGIHHFVSDSGITWEPQKLVEKKGHSPFIYQEDGCYYLLYEKHDKTGKEKSDSSSRIEMRSSGDLVTWSKPRIILEAKDIAIAGDYLNSPRVSHPQLLKINGIYRLYFGASEVVMPDTHRKVSRYFSYAVSPDLQGRYVQEEENRILIEAKPDSAFSNLGCGNVRVFREENRFYAFQSSVFWDEKKAASFGNLIMLKSEDGLEWESCSEKPVLSVSEKGWTDTYITAADVIFSNTDRSWYCYYSASGHNSKKKITDGIGLLIGAIPFVQESKDKTLREVLSSFFG